MTALTYALVANTMLVALTVIIIVSPIHVTSFLKNQVGAAVAALVLLIALATDASFFALCLLCLLCILIKLKVLVISSTSNKKERFTTKKCLNKAPMAHAVPIPAPTNEDRELIMPMGTEQEGRHGRRRSRYYADSSSSMGASCSGSGHSSGSGDSCYDEEEIVYETTGKACYEHYTDSEYSKEGGDEDDEEHFTMSSGSPFAQSSLDASEFNASDHPFRPLNAFRIDHRQQDSHIAGVIPRKQLI